MYKLSQRSINHLIGVDNRLQLLIFRVLQQSPHDFGIPGNGGFRTAKEQHALWLIGRTEGSKREPVTYLDGTRKRSYHQSGRAFDIYIYDEHGACWSCLDKYKEVSDIVFKVFYQMQEEGVFGKDEELRWGGNWKKPDMPHFELR